ncbi:MAG: hypothetical protein R3264_22805, partial [Anaerolineae bacterium]|nr:hypothetical protein [Anaerolineae bacterium]
PNLPLLGGGIKASPLAGGIEGGRRLAISLARWLRILNLTPLPLWGGSRGGDGGRAFVTNNLFTGLFIIFSIAGLYSHLYAGFLLPALGLWLLISYRHNRRLWLRFAGAGLIITLAYLPILLAIWRFSGEAQPGDPFTGLDQRVWWLLSSFTVWKASLHPVLQIGIPGLITLFAVLALVPFIRLPTVNYQLSISNYQFPKSTLLVSLLLLTPFVIATALLSRNYLAFFGERYFIVMTPWLLILAAIGVTKMVTWLGAGRGHPARRLLSLIPILLVLLGTVWPLPGQWQAAASKEFWRQSVDYLAEHAEPGDGILIHPDWVRYPFQFYFAGPGQTYGAFSDVTPATALDGPLQGVVGDHEVIWLIQSHLEGPDPNRLVEQWFAARYPLVTELYPPGITLKGYATGYHLRDLPDTATPTAIEFDNGLMLVGFEADRVATATDDFFHPPSGWLHVILYWAAGRPVTSDVVPVAQLVGPEGVWGISLDRASDALKLFPPSRWPVNSEEPLIIRQDLDINLNPVTPPGRYQVVV